MVYIRAEPTRQVTNKHKHRDLYFGIKKNPEKVTIFPVGLHFNTSPKEIGRTNVDPSCVSEYLTTEPLILTLDVLKLLAQNMQELKQSLVCSSYYASTIHEKNQVTYRFTWLSVDSLAVLLLKRRNTT